MRPAVIILTYNSEGSLPQTLESARQVSDEIWIVDSFSSDKTLQIAEEMGASVVQHPFVRYGSQRNWAMDSLRVLAPWQLHLDSDEYLTSELVAEIRALPESMDVDGFYLPRFLRFLGRVLRHGAMSPTWHLRLFRSGAARCEERFYDQHFYLKSGKARKLAGSMIDDVRMSLTEWTARHNRWSDAEMTEQLERRRPERIRGKALGDPVERKRFLRQFYDRAPLFLRPFALFFYRFVLRFGFLDGRQGFVFWILQTFWFRFLVDAKLFEYGLRQGDCGECLLPVQPLRVEKVSEERS